MPISNMNKYRTPGQKAAINARRFMRNPIARIATGIRTVAPPVIAATAGMGLLNAGSKLRSGQIYEEGEDFGTEPGTSLNTGLRALTGVARTVGDQFINPERNAKPGMANYQERSNMQRYMELGFSEEESAQLVAAEAKGAKQRQAVMDYIKSRLFDK